MNRLDETINVWMERKLMRDFLNKEISVLEDNVRQQMSDLCVTEYNSKPNRLRVRISNDVEKSIDESMLPILLKKSDIEKITKIITKQNLVIINYQDFNKAIRNLG